MSFDAESVAKRICNGESEFAFDAFQETEIPFLSVTFESDAISDKIDRYLPVEDVAKAIEGYFGAQYARYRLKGTSLYVCDDEIGFGGIDPVSLLEL